MDHAIDNLKIYFDLSYEELVEEWKSGEYKKLSECPSYKEANAYREAINVLVKACYLPEYVQEYMFASLSQQIREQVEIENFWAEQSTFKK
jgi:hypothetical protein